MSRQCNFCNFMPLTKSKNTLKRTIKGPITELLFLQTSPRNPILTEVALKIFLNSWNWVLSFRSKSSHLGRQGYQVHVSKSSQSLKHRFSITCQKRKLTCLISCQCNLKSLEPTPKDWSCLHPIFLLCLVYSFRFIPPIPCAPGPSCHLYTAPSPRA